MVQTMGMSERRSQYATARSTAAFAFSNHRRTYIQQLRNEVLISPVKIKETLTVNYVFTWDFCWVLNVNLHVQITCRQLYTSLSLLMLMGQLRKQTRVYVPSPSKRLRQPATQKNVTNRPHSFLITSFQRKGNTFQAMRLDTLTMGGQQTSVARYTCVE
jgi:hypothetical protein